MKKNKIKFLLIIFKKQNEEKNILNSLPEIKK